METSQRIEDADMELTGSVIAILYKNEQNGYTVGRLETDTETVSFTGSFATLNEGDFITLIGDYETHPRYGLQFKAESSRPEIPRSEQQIFNYLSSGILPGIGAKTAELIVERFGTDSLDILETTPERLLEVKGIGKKTLVRIKEAFLENREKIDTVAALAEYDVSTAAAIKLYKVFGPQTVSQLLSDPFVVMREVPGYGFKRAEQLAQKLGLEREDPRRIKAGIEWVLSSCYTEGNTYIEENELIKAAARTLDVTEEQAAEVIIKASDTGEMRCETSEEGEILYYPEALYLAEDAAALSVARLSSVSNPLDVKDLEGLLSRIEYTLSFRLDPSQIDAIRSSADSSISIITGGPGTGKTTIIHGILLLYDSLGIDAKLAAPTGRAAKRMSEATGREASTIHRLLEYDPQVGFMRDADNPIEADAIIIDESSMIDIELFAALLDALRPETRIIFVGDADQLPSVGPGNVLNELIVSGCVPTAALNTIHRQKEGSVISTNAHLINEGKRPHIDNQSDFMLIGKNEEEIALHSILYSVAEGMPKTFGLNAFEDIQVLSPFKKGKLGVENLNFCLQERLNPKAPYKEEIVWGETSFREGDKVMQMQNNYNIPWTDEDGFSGEGVFNGDIGIIDAIEDEEILITFTDGRQAIYARENLGQLSLAYCSTVHKAQGSEFPAVILALPSANPFLNRRLLYTAVTRAKKKMVLLGKKNTFSYMIQNTADAKRKSRLSEKIIFYRNLNI